MWNTSTHKKIWKYCVYPNTRWPCIDNNPNTSFSSTSSSSSTMELPHIFGPCPPYCQVFKQWSFYDSRMSAPCPMPHDQLPTWTVRVSLFVQYFTRNLSSIRSLLAALLPPEKLQQLHLTTFIFKENTQTKHVYNCVQLHSNPNTTPSIFQTCIRKEFSSYTHINKAILKKSISLDTGRFRFTPGLHFWKHYANQTKNSHLKVFPGGQRTDLILYSVWLYH